MKNDRAAWIKQKLEEMRPNIYAFGESSKLVGQLFNLERSKIVKLNANENFFIPREKLLALMMEALEEFDPRIYPQGEEDETLREKLGGYVGLSANYIAVGNGGDELIARVANLFLERGEQAITISPTFTMYHYAVKLQRAEVIEVPLKTDFSLNIEALLSKVTPKTRLLFLCSPNNPTANQFEIDDIKFLIENFPGIVAVDEAYVEFADYSLVPLVPKYDNLIVIRTFSKAFGLAGLRLGYCIANDEIIRTLSKNVGLPYPVSIFSLKVGVKVLENMDIFEEAFEKTRIERKKLMKSLNAIDGVKAFNSKTNFVLFKTEKPSDNVYRSLLEKGVLVRKMGTVLGFQNCLRTTVGLPWMNARLIEILKETCQSNSGG
ncbi:MAG: histidinol-phosphate transaminase [Candidatus Bathyarchaeia archaeon]|nr:histidinol-phosphate transaminase [Candidatus Bathyarchaeota archaeon]